MKKYLYLLLIVSLASPNDLLSSQTVVKVSSEAFDVFCKNFSPTSTVVRLNGSSGEAFGMLCSQMTSSALSHSIIAPRNATLDGENAGRMILGFGRLCFLGFSKIKSLFTQDSSVVEKIETEVEKVVATTITDHMANTGGSFVPFSNEYIDQVNKVAETISPSVVSSINTKTIKDGTGLVAASISVIGVGNVAIKKIQDSKRDKEQIDLAEKSSNINPMNLDESELETLAKQEENCNSTSEFWRAMHYVKTESKKNSEYIEIFHKAYQEVATQSTSYEFRNLLDQLDEENEESD